ncbi:MAG: BadF/BadG/BcrA/BcrD ATPase family protein, partial [Anaeromassilibacillus sp.]
GNPVPIIREYLLGLYHDHPNIQIRSSAVTGYGEELLKNAFGIDWGIVETVAHFTAAKHFLPDVDFVIDIGGQDMKCFKIRKGAIDNIFLNEACSSGCGSFLQTFANTLGYSIQTLQSSVCLPSIQSIWAPLHRIYELFGQTGAKDGGNEDISAACRSAL